MTEEVTWGGIYLLAATVRERTYDRNVSRLTQSPEGQRDSEAGLVKAVISTFHTGGLRPDILLGNWQRDLDKYRNTEGLIAHIPFGLYLPFLLTTQESISGGEDISGFAAASKRIHAINSTLAASRLAFYVALGTKFLRETSSSDPALIVCTTSGLPANKTLTAIGEFRCADGVFLVVGVRDNTKVGVLKTSDPTAGTVTFAEFAASGSASTTAACWGLTRADYLGIGFNIAYGYLDNAAAAGANAVIGPLLASPIISPSTSNAWFEIEHAVTGSEFVVPRGGYMVGILPSNATRMVLVVPAADEETTILLPRRLIYVDLSTNADGTILSGLPSTPDTGLDHIEHAVPFLGGVAVLGGRPGSMVNRGCKVHLVGADGVVRDLGFPGENGSTQWAGISMLPLGRYLKVTAVSSALTDAIDFVWTPEGAWHALSPLQSKSVAIAAQPLAYAESTFAIEQGFRYMFYPASTATNVARIFTPPNQLDNPIIKNTSQNKHYGALNLHTVDMDVGGPVEANKTLIVQQYLNGLASVVGGTYGTVTLRTYNGDVMGAFSDAFTAPVFDTAFEVYNVPSGGVSVRTQRQVFSLQNDGTSMSPSTKTPNGLPVLNVYAVKWPKLSEWEIVIDLDATLAKNRHKHWTEFSQALKDKENITASGKPVQQFKYGTVDKPATLEYYDIVTGQALLTRTAPGNSAPRLLFREAPGTTS